MTAAVNLAGERPRVFAMVEETPAAARGTMEQYRAYLKSEGQDVQWNESSGRLTIESGEPLYGRVVAVQTGRLVIGVIGAADSAAAGKLIENLQNRFTR